MQGTGLEAALGQNPKLTILVGVGQFSGSPFFKTEILFLRLFAPWVIGFLSGYQINYF